MEASSSSSLCDVDALEQELRLELERFEHLFDEDIEEASVSNLNISNSLNAFELAEAEGEKEFLQDKLALTLSKSEEQEKLLVEAEFKISNLAKRNLTLQEENDTLRHEMMQMSKLSYLQSLKEDQGGGQSPIADTSKPSAADYSALEYMLAETRSKLARAQQAHEDQVRCDVNLNCKMNPFIVPFTDIGQRIS